MKLIKQLNSLDCGYAAAAMFCGQSYAAARRADPHPTWRRGVNLADMATICCALGHAIKFHRPAYRPLVGFSGIDCRLYLIREKGKAAGHWIVSCDGLIYDPEHSKPAAVGEYDRRAWDVIRWAG